MESESETDETRPSTSSKIFSKKRNRPRSSTPEKTLQARGESSTKKTHRAQLYRKEWESNPDFKTWLAPVDNDKSKASCKVCKATFLSELTVIKQHSKGQKHIKNVTAASQKSLTQVFGLQKLQKSKEDEVKVASIKLCAYLAEHKTAFSSSDHLFSVCQSAFPDSKIAEKLKLGRTKATAVVKNVIGKYEGECLTHTLRQNKFSIIMDESTDIGCSKNVAICVRYFDNTSGEVESKFWKLLPVFENPDAANAGATGEKLFQLLLDELNNDGIPLDNVVGFASDGCNVMMGEHDSVKSRLKQHFPGITIINCICHSLHLCASEACKKLPRRCEDLCRDIYNFFKTSSKRQTELVEFQVFCEEEPHKILKPSQTRWLSLLMVVKRILEQWEPLRLYFTSKWFEHRLNAAENIYRCLNDKHVKLFFLFLEWVLPKFVHLNAHFQSEQVVITTLHDKMESTLRDLLLAYMKPEYINRTKLTDIDPSKTEMFMLPKHMYLGIGVLAMLNTPEGKQNLEEDQVTDFYVRCRNFLITSCQEIKKRYSFDDPVFSKLSTLNGRKAVSVSETRESSLYPLMQCLPRLVKDVSTQQKIDDQWRSLAGWEFPSGWEDLQVDKFWNVVKNTKNMLGEELFADLGRFVLDLLVLPQSNAACERLFSQINLIKTKSRNKLITKTVTGVLLASQHVQSAGGCAKFQPPQEMVKLMTSSNLYAAKTKLQPEGESVVQEEEVDDELTFE